MEQYPNPDPLSRRRHSASNPGLCSCAVLHLPPLGRKGEGLWQGEG